MREVLLAKSAGFCYGVRRAVELAEQLAQSQPVYLLGEITHNDHVISKLEQMGAVTVHGVEEIPQGATVLIRAHGEPDAVYDRLSEKHCQVVDATCPNVTHIHDIVRKACSQGRTPVILGDADHPEIVGIAGCAENAVVAENWEELDKIFQKRPDPKPRPFGRIGKIPLKTQKKCVQMRNTLIQYVVLRLSVKLRRLNWPAGVTV